MKKTILITGAGSGIGKDTALALAKRGHDVIATTETDEQSLTLKNEAAQTGLRMNIFKLNILNETDRNKIEAYDLDVLINNAGVGESGSMAEIDIGKVRYNFEVNVFSAFQLSQIALRKMFAGKKGTVLFISSLAAKIPMPFLAPYCMSKAALSCGAEALRKEIHQIEKNIHVSIIEPGAYHTGFNQKNIAKKFVWMNRDSYFYSITALLKSREERQFRTIEMNSTKSIVSKIVKAAEANKPRLRYSAPWWQAFGIYILRLFGK